ncbi:activating transcription factor 3 [Schistocerca piceifrons]|uniref:activating transcription factor 3 n=1 Tax=Schistocerca piceifrons TaxID=274613 RepID=UPI001F5E69A4|nr:activating transcription factor 3 [Schistocerca piceifrons]
MYNLNVNVNLTPGGVGGGPAGLLGVEGACTTPKTPEILNSLIAMSNPFDGYPTAAGGGAGVAGGGVGGGPRIASVPPGHSSLGDGGCASGGGSASRSPLSSPTGTPPSVQHMCSQLIKDSLKMTIQKKREATGSALLDDGAYGPERGPKAAKREGDDELTPEDEERRRRRRERNKIAATKCRLKKRERTVNLVQESEILETQNHDLKSQIQDLEAQRRRLIDMLSMHTPTCLKNSGGAPPTAGSTGTQSGDNFGTNGDSLPQTYEAFIASSTYHQHHHHHHHNHHAQQHHQHQPEQQYPSSCNYSSGYPSPGAGIDGGCMA